MDHFMWISRLQSKFLNRKQTLNKNYEDEVLNFNLICITCLKDGNFFKMKFVQKRSKSAKVIEMFPL